MSCPGKGYGTNPQSDAYLTAQFSMTSTRTPTSTRNCRKFTGFYPSFAPILYYLSVTFSYEGQYVLVYATGENFFPNTYIRFGSYGDLPAVYYSSFTLSFVVPLNAVPNVYNVQAVNVYNNNFSPGVNQSYSGNLNFSNAIPYVILGPEPPPPPPPTFAFTVAVGNGNNGDIAYSTNGGLVWSPTSSNTFTFGGLSVAYNGSLWVAGGTIGFAYSFDGIHWSSSASIFIPNGIAFNESLWIAVGIFGQFPGTSTISYSYDGISWNNQLPSNFPGSSSLNGIAWNGTFWVIVGQGFPNTIFYSNGVTWVPANNSFDVLVRGNAVAWNGVIWVAVGQLTSSGPGVIVYSSDGINWSYVNNATGIFLIEAIDVAWSGTMWVAVGGTPAIAYSYDGINWIAVLSTNSLFPNGCNGIVWNGTIWVAVGNSIGAGNSIAYSYDAINWYGLGNSVLSTSGVAVASTYVPPLLTPPEPLFYWSLQSGVLCAGYTVIAPQVLTTLTLPTSLTPAPNNAWILSGTQLSTTWNIVVLSLAQNATTTSTTSSTLNYWFIDTSTANTIYTTYPIQVKVMNTLP